MRILMYLSLKPLTVSHEIQINRFKSIENIQLNWLQSYKANKRQYVDLRLLFESINQLIHAKPLRKK